jgi:hypothetical protein
MWEKRNSYKTLVGKPEVKKPLGSRRRREVDDSEIYIKETLCEDVKWIKLAADIILVSTLMNSRVE